MLEFWILFTLDQGVVLAMKIAAGCLYNLIWTVFHLPFDISPNFFLSYSNYFKMEYFKF